MSYRVFYVVALVGVTWSCVLGLQRPPPRYSQQYMPDTSFSCRNKIVGSYYADAETDCQLFHVCVSVAGTIQDYKFLCPNNTAFDQESQTCADWYDVDCEAATLYYSSDNFDLYRLGSGLESLHYDSVRSDAEPQDHLQRSETSDPVRSSVNNRPSSSNNKNNNNGNSNSRDILRGSSSINFYNSRNEGKDEDYENDKVYHEESTIVQEPKKKGGVRKVARKQSSNYNSSNNNNANYGNNYESTSAVTPVVATGSSSPNNYNGNYYSHYNRQRTNTSPTSTSSTPVAADAYNNKNNNVRNQNNNQKYNVPTTTYRSSTAQQTYSAYQSSATTPKTTAYNGYTNNNAFNANNNDQQQTSNSYGQSIVTSPRSTNYYPSTSIAATYRTTGYVQTHNSQFGRTEPTTVQPSTNYQPSASYTNYPRNYNNIQRSTGTVNAFPTTTIISTTFQDSYESNRGSSYVPTTYRPSSINKSGLNDNSPISGNTRISDRPITQSSSNNNGQYNEQQLSAKSTQYYDSTRSPKKNAVENYSVSSNTRGNDRYNSPTTINDNGQYTSGNQQPSSKTIRYYETTRAPKKATQYNANYDLTNNGKYYESSTGTYDNGRSQAGIGFSPSSVNHLAETTRSTTPVPKRTGSPSTYNPQSFNTNKQSQTTPRSTTYANGSARPFSTTARYTDATTPKPKSGKKNDYDYAYYDNAGALEYDGLDLEHVVASNKESTKITRN